MLDVPTFHQRTLTISNIDSQQQLMFLPLDWVRRYPDSYRAELREVKVGVMALRIVDPRTPERHKRYQVVRHHGSAWVSIPRPWLRDRNARNGDEVELKASTDPDVFYLVFHRASKGERNAHCP